VQKDLEIFREKLAPTNFKSKGFTQPLRVNIWSTDIFSMTEGNRREGVRYSWEVEIVYPDDKPTDDEFVDESIEVGKWIREVVRSSVEESGMPMIWPRREADQAMAS